MSRILPTGSLRQDYARIVANAINALTKQQEADKTSTTRGEIIYTPKAEPADPVEGQTYMDSTTHKLRTYDGTTWQAHW